MYTIVPHSYRAEQPLNSGLAIAELDSDVPFVGLPLRDGEEKCGVAGRCARRTRAQLTPQGVAERFRERRSLRSESAKNRASRCAVTRFDHSPDTASSPRAPSFRSLAGISAHHTAYSAVGSRRLESSYLTGTPAIRMVIGSLRVDRFPRSRAVRARSIRTRSTRTELVVRSPMRMVVLPRVRSSGERYRFVSSDPVSGPEDPFTPQIECSIGPVDSCCHPSPFRSGVSMPRTLSSRSYTRLGLTAPVRARI